MLVAGLTGGIGSGKSTFAALLAERGAQVIDADLLGHEALRAGQPAWHSVVDQFGDEILSHPGMEIDRVRLAAVAFSDRQKLAALNAIVHPVIVAGIADRLDLLRATDAVVVVDAALIVELGLDEGMDALMVVLAGRETRQKRLRSQRGMRPEDIDSRMTAQSSDAELEARADIVVRNDGTLEDLAREADRVWTELTQRQLR